MEMEVAGAIAAWILQTASSPYSKCDTCHACLTCTHIHNYMTRALSAHLREAKMRMRSTDIIILLLIPYSLQNIDETLLVCLIQACPVP